MRLGFSTVMYEETDLTYSEIVRKADQLGYEGIELNLREWPSESNVDQIKESLDGFNVEVAAIGTRHMHVTHRLYLASPSKNVREKALNYVTECVKIARRLNCPIVQAGWAFQGSKLEAQYDAAWKQAVESLKEVGSRCLEHGLQFVIEFACKQNAELVNTMEEALRMLDEVGSENVLVMADVFHIYMENDSLRNTVLKAGDRLGYVHLADSDRLITGTGKINFPEFVDALREIDYKGYMIMEFNPGSNPDEPLKQALEYTKRLL
ncbi:MAG: sugar phosphate isomerase/epimerase family protein [Candidatus Bathyarchaeia archaeon]